jgi:hypothetical protein
MVGVFLATDGVVAVNVTGSLILSANVIRVAED